MGTKGIVGICIVIVLFVLSLIGFTSAIGYRNECVQLGKTIDAQVTDMKAKYNEYFLKIKEAAQVPERQLEQLKQIYDKIVSGRTTNGTAVMFKFIQENNPNIDQSTYAELQDIIKAGRSEIYNIQKVHIDTVREYNTYISLFPNNIFNLIFGFKSKTPTVPIADKVNNVFETGIDEAVQVF